MATTPKRIYTDAEVLQIAEQVVSEFGRDYVYPRNPGWVQHPGNGCNYVRDGRPSCLIGHIAVRMGMTIDMLLLFEGQQAHCVMGYGEAVKAVSPVRADQWPFSVSQRASSALGRAQNAQDEGRNWGYALDVLREFLN